MNYKLYPLSHYPFIIALSISIFVHFSVIVVPELLRNRDSNLNNFTLVQLVDTSVRTGKPIRKKKKEISQAAITDNTPKPVQAPAEEIEDDPQETEENYSEYIPFFKVQKLPEFKVQVKPQYPAKAKLASIESEVVVEVYIDALGSPRKVVVIRSGGDIFDSATIDAVIKSLFSPAVSKDGQPVPVRVRIPYKFELE